MEDKRIDETLKQAAAHEVDPALLDRIGAALGSSLDPVRPLPPAWILTGGLVLICAGVAVAGAAVLGFHGIEKLSFLEGALIFPALALLISLAATSCAGQMIPGSRHRVAPPVLLAGCSLALVTVFAVLFRDYRTVEFVPQGIACLTAGLALAIPAALGSWVLLRRGFAVNTVTAGLVAGTLAGLAGVTMLELHCPNFELFHVMLWHTAVIPISGAAGALLAWAAARFRSLR